MICLPRTLLCEDINQWWTVHRPNFCTILPVDNNTSPLLTIFWFSNHVTQHFISDQTLNITFLDIALFRGWIFLFTGRQPLWFSLDITIADDSTCKIFGSKSTLQSWAKGNPLIKLRSSWMIRNPVTKFRQFQVHKFVLWSKCDCI